MRPEYLQAGDRLLRERAERALSILGSCRLCPRQCQVNRLEGETGFCQSGRFAPVASYHLHFGEEAPLVGDRGSGTIFFAGCNLGCLFCQNYDISHNTRGAPEADPLQLAEVMLELQRQGALNINLVTPTHVLPQILEALPLAAEKGLNLPLVYNCGGYEETQSLALLEGIVDIYMPDLKFADPEVASRLAQAEDYPDKARRAVFEMHRQVGDLRTDEQGRALRGLIIRHLLLPGNMAGTRQWLEFLAREVSTGLYLNLMDQYHPCGEARRDPELCRPVTSGELREARDLAKSLGLERLDSRDRGLRELLRRL